jgi:muramoyltetrapeptide carboxypeptidase LdcA involved in peptidoglycan recycling
MGNPTPSPKWRLIPRKFQRGDNIRVLALSRSLAGVMKLSNFTEEDIAFAQSQLESLGLTVSFGAHVRDCNEHLTAAIEARLQDLRDALSDVSVRGILAVSGGIGAVQILDGLDYGMFTAYPKIFCGYSDIGYLCNAIFSRSGLVTYYGPHFTSFMARKGAEYTLQNFKACLFQNGALDVAHAHEWSDDDWAKEQEKREFLPTDGWWAINGGAAEGTIIGGNGFCLNMLQGSPYFPPLHEAILFIEHPSWGKASLMTLDSILRALTYQQGFDRVLGIVIGRFSRDAGITHGNLLQVIQAIPALSRIPVLANCDFGHTTPMLTLPIGGQCRLRVREGKAEILVTEH